MSQPKELTYFGALRKSPEGNTFLDSRSIAVLPAAVEDLLAREKKSVPVAYAMYPVVRIVQLRVRIVDEELE